MASVAGKIISSSANLDTSDVTSPRNSSFPENEKSISDVTEKSKLDKSNRKRTFDLEPEYARLIVNGITIQLPPGFKPYPSQQLMFVKLIQSLKNRKNAMIESPTGSGKSLGLLSACCAWLQDYKVQRKIAKQKCPKHGASVNNNNESSDVTILDIDDGIIQHENEIDTTDATDIKIPRIDPSDIDSPEIRNDGFNELETECTCSHMKKIRLYYGTRTHKQISQVIKEFSRLPYGREKGDKQLRHSILASREQSCINPDVRKMADITTACKERIAPDGIGCVYRRNLKNFEDPTKLRRKIANLGVGVWDIEDLAEALKSPEICAYYASNRLMIGDADIIFTPFNYLLDPIIRNSSDVNLKNSIVILDEAHNVEQTSRSSVSFQFKESEFLLVLNSFHEKITLMTRNSMVSMLKDIDKGNLENSEYLKELDKFKESMNRLSDLSKRLFNLFSELAKTLDGSSNRDCKTWNWNTFQTLLKNDDPEKNLFFERDSPLFKLYLTDFQVITSQKSKDENSSSSNGGDPTSDLLNEFKVSPVAIVMIEKFLYFMTYFQIEKNMESFRCNITFTPHIQPIQNSERFTQLSRRPRRSAALFYSEERSVDRITPLNIQPIRVGYDATLNFWCMSPSVAFTEAFKECHSVILASGTLCPMESLKSELGFEFQNEMEGKQVIPDEQIFASVVSVGPSGYRFKCTFKNMQDQMFYIQLLKTILDVCKTVPKGVLVFVSSYRIINDLKKYMEYENLKNDIQKYKKIFYEPNKSNELKDVLEDYTFAIKRQGSDIKGLNGAILFAVFRGKVSEGIDFSDDMARCVMCVGIPFPNATDELVLQKKAYNNLHSGKSKMLTGDEWYSTEAYRALNQALGRCLRHRNDWGAILLIDERFIEKANPKCPDSKKISRWVRHRLVRYNDHPSLIDALSDFVNERLKDDKLKPVQINLNGTAKSPTSSTTFSIANFFKKRGS